jgi:ATP synthase protein I
MDPKKPESKPSSNSFLKYSGLGFQMIGIILLGTFGGIKLDEYLSLKPLFTIIGVLFSVGMSMYFAIKEFLKK